jgi:hypothetical protein
VKDDRGPLTLHFTVAYMIETAEEQENVHKRMTHAYLFGLRGSGVGVGAKRVARERLEAEILAFLNSPAAREAFEDERARAALAKLEAAHPEEIVTGPLTDDEPGTP